MIKTPAHLFMGLLMLIFCSAFALNIQAAIFTVSTTTDSGIGSLRQAVNDANSAASDDIILFDSGLIGQAIVLASEIQISNNGTLVITGDGANVNTIDGGPGTNRIFFSNGATVTISGVTLTGGNGTGAVESGDGGAIYANGGTLVIDSVHVTKNLATGQGGGISFNNGTGHQILNSTFSANVAVDCGGFYNKNSELNVTNSTISGNKAIDISTETASGGGFCSTGDTTLRSVTITGNSADDFGGGSEIGGGTLNLGDTIVAVNTTTTTSSDIHRLSGTITTVGYNLIGKNDSVEAEFPAGNLNTNNDIVGSSNTPIDPLLDPILKNNGGATPTHNLLIGSPAIDKGNSFGTSTDQRGMPRPVDNPTIPNAAGGSGSDIGALEVQFAPTAAPGTIRGRVLTLQGKAIAKAKVKLTDQNGDVRYTITNPFGYYLFNDVSVGGIFVINAVHKKYTFHSQVLSFNGSLSEVDLISEN